MANREKHKLYAIVTEINWEYDTNLSLLVVDKVAWESGLCSVLAIKDEVQRDGVHLSSL